MRRTIFITNAPAPYRHDLFTHLSNEKDLQMEVIFCTTEEELLERGWKFENINYPHRVCKSWLSKIWFNPYLLFYLFKQKPDVVIVSGILPAILSLIYNSIHKCQLVLWWAGTVNSEKGIGRSHIFLREFLFKRADKFIAYSEEAGEYLKTFGLSIDKIKVLGNVTFDVERFGRLVSEARDDIEFRTKWPENIVLGIGKLIEYKNYKKVIDAFNKAFHNKENYCLLLIGEGPQRKELEDFCTSKDIRNVLFLGSIPYSEIYKYYAISSIFVHPSKLDRWPQVVNEALSSGLPVLASREAGIPEHVVVWGENGYLIDPDDVSLWASMLVSLFSNNRMMKQMGEKSRDIVGDYSISKISKVILSTFKEPIE